jgi:group II intron reverse transcriptase/maturase
MVANHTFIDIVHKCGLKGYTLEGVYRRMQDRDLFLTAYGNLYANKGALTPGVDALDTVDGMSLDRIDAIIEKLRSNSYRWTPVRRTYVPKKTGGKRPLGLPAWSDKLLQEVIRMILEAYYEPRFSDNSHGFRPQRGCHTALQDIYHRWTGTKWFVEGDIKGCFDNLRHEIILDIVRRDIKDNRFLKLVWAMLKAGYMENWEYHRTFSGAPQGGVASPILSNIVLNELDQFVENELIPAYTKGQARRANGEYVRLTLQIKAARKAGNRELVKELTKRRRATPSRDTHDPNYRRLRYSRYCDDFILGFAGPRHEAEEIKERVSIFLETMGLTMSEEKTLITHAVTDKARYLNYDVTVATAKTRPRVNYRIKLLAPPEVKAEWLKRYTRKGKPCHRTELLDMSDFEIVATYGSEFRGIVNYYSLAENVSGVFYQVKHAAIGSAVKTLAAKHRTTAGRIHRKYRKASEHGVSALIVELPNPNRPEKPYRAQLGEKPIKRKRKTVIQDQAWTPAYSRTELTERLLAYRCELCGSQEKMEAHHIRRLADMNKRYRGRAEPPPWTKFMMARRRKTIVVCANCHRRIHSGTYDGRNVV